MKCAAEGRRGCQDSISLPLLASLVDYTTTLKLASMRQYYALIENFVRLTSFPGCECESLIRPGWVDKSAPACRIRSAPMEIRPPGGRSRMAHAVPAKPTSRCACLR